MDENNRSALGTGSATAHHGEILQGVFRDDRGRLRRALVTLQCPEWKSHAVFRPSPGETAVTSSPGMWKSCRAADISMAEFSTEQSPPIGGYVEIRSEVPRGIGMGSSTADVTAAIRAVADFHRITPTAEEIGRIAVRAESASDPVMIDDCVVLFCHREGVVLETFGSRLPSIIVVGCHADPDINSVDTIALPPAVYSEAEIDTFQALRRELRGAIAAADVARLGRVATSSALISQRFLPKSAFDFLLNLCERTGGHGVQVAHSGTVAGLIFDSRREDVLRSVDRCISGIDKAGLSLTGVIGASQVPTAGPVIQGQYRLPARVAVQPGHQVRRGESGNTLVIVSERRIREQRASAAGGAAVEEGRGIRQGADGLQAVGRRPHLLERRCMTTAAPEMRASVIP
jgi:uncharacterized protein involved in propanediol utilization